MQRGAFMTRPKKGESLIKTKGVHLRMSETEYEILSEKAIATNMSISDFIEKETPRREILGITSEAARSTMKGVQKKAISALQLPDYLIEQLQTVNHNNKLTNNDKATIKQMFDDGYTMAYIAEQFNVSKMTISRVINGRKDRQVGK